MMRVFCTQRVVKTFAKKKLIYATPQRSSWPGHQTHRQGTMHDGFGEQVLSNKPTNPQYRVRGRPAEMGMPTFKQAPGPKYLLPSAMSKQVSSEQPSCAMPVMGKDPRTKPTPEGANVGPGPGAYSSLSASGTQVRC
jgi:hypothetical protein